jgi:hypothetical protein
MAGVARPEVLRVGFDTQIRKRNQQLTLRPPAAPQARGE